MRVPIRVQLALLVLFTSTLALSVLSIATWMNNYNFVVSIKSQGLSLIASLKAGQIASDLELLETTCGAITTRILLQAALQRFYNYNNNTEENWIHVSDDIQFALSSGGYSQLLQVRVYSRNGTGDPHGLLNITADNARDILLPMFYPNSTQVRLGDSDISGVTGMPPSLYPNLTYTGLSGIHDGEPKGIGNTFVQAFTDVDLKSPLLLGPLRVNSSFAMVSLTLPIINQTSHIDVMGYMTILAQASALYNIQKSREGLDLTGEVLILRPSEPQNKFPPPERPSSQGHTANRTLLESADVLFIFPLDPTPGQADRHSFHNISNFRETFPLSSYPAALDAFSNMNPNLNNASSDLSTTNEQGQQVAVGYARPQTKLVDWVLIVEQTKAEAFGPVVQLRRILLGCVFGTLGLILLLVVPMAHWSVKPITRLKEATEKSIQPPGYSPKGSIRSQNLLGPSDGSVDEETGEDRISTQQSKCSTGIFVRMRRLGRRQKSKAELNEDARRRVFKIPGKVIDRKHYITDELTELTSTFNEMSDELMMQYSKLEERVAERTRELEVSKKAAEAANESKTLFIANISHELKTPLNGILGMCAVCMGEDDLSQIKRSLQVVYKSGDLLLHLLNDLLTFSKNQIGQSISIEEKEFGLSDIKSQVVTIFDKQVEEGNINLAVNFIGTGEAEFGVDKDKVFGRPLPALGPNGTGRLKDMRLWGDQHRILQVLINLVGNSLKFTPQGGKIEVRIRCIGEKETSSNEGRKDSMGSKQGSISRSSRNRHRIGSDSNAPAASRLSSSSSKPVGTALLINPMDPKASTTHIQGRERSPTPPPANARTLIFEFEVEDTGPGIPANLQERVFEPFVQGDLGLNRKYGGTGLGLSICSQLAGLMGGTITLESSEGQGSIFSMRIPLKFVGERVSSTASSSVAGGSRPPSVTSRDDARPTKLSVDLSTPTVSVNNGQAMGFEKDMQPRLVGLSQPFFSAPSSAEANTDKQLAAFDRVAAPKRDSGKIRVLVAEDNLVNQEVVLRMLKLEDIYDVTVAKDGQEAYEKVKASMEQGLEYNLIFMDIQMPNLDGLQSTRLIRQMGYSAPIIALTAFSEESNVKECMDSGMNMFLSKPIRRPALKQALKRFATIPEEPEPTDLTWNNAEKNVNGDKGQSHPSNPEKPTDVTDLPTKSNTIPTDSGEHPASPHFLTTRHPPPYSPLRSPISNGDKENQS